MPVSRVRDDSIAAAMRAIARSGKETAGSRNGGKGSPGRREGQATYSQPPEGMEICSNRSQGNEPQDRPGERQSFEVPGHTCAGGGEDEFAAIAHCNNMDAMRSLLQKDSRIPQLDVRSYSDEMRALLGFNRRLKLLYHQEGPAIRATPLDEALREWRLDDARTIFREEVGDRSARDVWANAIENEQLDVLRYMMLMPETRSTDFRLYEDEKKKISDPRIKRLADEIPAYRPEFGTPGRANAKVKYRGSSKLIECRTFVEYYQQEVRKSANHEFNFNEITDFHSIATRITRDMEVTYDRARERATGIYLVENRLMSAFLGDMFRHLKQHDLDTMLITHSSVNHVMSINLKIVQDELGEAYETEFYDPNFTRNGVRDKKYELNAFGYDGLDAYLDARVASTREGTYFPNGAKFSLMLVRPAESTLSTSKVAADSWMGAKSLTAVAKSGNVDPSVIFMLMRSGCGGSIAEWESEILSLPPAERRAMLLAKKGGRRSGGDSALHAAVNSQYPSAIEAWAHLLQRTIPEDERFPIAAYVDPESRVSAFSDALRTTNHVLVASFASVINALPRHTRSEFLLARDEEGAPAICLAIMAGREAVVKAWGGLLDLVPEGDLAALLMPRSVDGGSALSAAMRNGHIGVIDQYIQIVSDALARNALNEVQKEELLLYIRSSHASSVAGHWRNHEFYTRLVRENPEWYERFKAMKGALKA
ncbi:MAG TPA: ShET2/EspL2 family type III secretion system effector toxin [Noviherbaspirillum sp.]|uniref:ShET2/EspL2 family type III secretion system effector toxin n=1 Tax=Noviherbaspirillum sp. TaxID=1926288 RepID=UPI002F92B47B